MIDIILLIILIAVLNWAVLDIYFYSVIFAPIRQYGTDWSQSRNWLSRTFRYLLGCPFCLSHWTAAINLAITSAVSYAGWLPVLLHPMLAMLLIPVVARLSLVLTDYLLPPLINVHTQENKEEEKTPDYQQEATEGVSATTDTIAQSN